MQSVVKAASVGQLAKASCLGVPVNTALPAAAAVAGPVNPLKRGIISTVVRRNLVIRHFTYLALNPWNT